MRRFGPLVAGLLVAACGSGDNPAPEVVTGEVPSADGVAIQYEVRGSGQPTLVLVHGWTNDRSIWGDHLRTLADGHRVVALDLAGHGASGTDRAAWTVDAFSGDVVAVADALGLQEMVLVGFSMGAAVVLETAEAMPDRVAGVVLVDALTDPSAVLTAGAATEIEAMFRANWGDTAFIRAFAYSPDAPDSLVQGLTERMAEKPREHWFATLPYVAAWMETELEPTLRALDVPVAAITTAQTPTDLETMQALAPGFTVDTLAGVGHAGLLHRRVPDFDARLLALVRRFSGAGG